MAYDLRGPSVHQPFYSPHEGEVAVITTNNNLIFNRSAKINTTDRITVKEIGGDGIVIGSCHFLQAVFKNYLHY